MDNLLYVTLTNIISLISLIGAVIIIAVFIIKKTIKPKSIVLFLIFLIGIYLYFPMKLLTVGFIHQNPKMLKWASVISINPYERYLCYRYLADIYANDIYYQGIKDGNKAIDYMEKAIRGRYSIFKNETGILAYWYSIKGDEEKTFQLLDNIDIKNGIIPLNIYIMKDDYQNALNTFDDNNKGIENFLKADICKKLGKNDIAKEAKTIAQIRYDAILSNLKSRARKIEYKEEAEKYQTIEAYKSWILGQRREFSF